MGNQDSSVSLYAFDPLQWMYCQNKDALTTKEAVISQVIRTSNVLCVEVFLLSKTVQAVAFSALYALTSLWHILGTVLMALTFRAEVVTEAKLVLQNLADAITQLAKSCGFALSTPAALVVGIIRPTANPWLIDYLGLYTPQAMDANRELQALLQRVTRVNLTDKKEALHMLKNLKIQWQALAESTKNLENYALVPSGTYENLGHCIEVLLKDASSSPTPNDAPSSSNDSSSIPDNVPPPPPPPPGNVPPPPPPPPGKTKTEAEIAADKAKAAEETKKKKLAEVDALLKQEQAKLESLQGKLLEVDGLMKQFRNQEEVITVRFKAAQKVHAARKDLQSYERDHKELTVLNQSIQECKENIQKNEAARRFLIEKIRGQDPETILDIQGCPSKVKQLEEGVKILEQDHGELVEKHAQTVRLLQERQVVVSKDSQKEIRYMCGSEEICQTFEKFTKTFLELKSNLENLKPLRRMYSENKAKLIEQIKNNQKVIQSLELKREEILTGTTRKNNPNEENKENKNPKADMADEMKEKFKNRTNAFDAKSFAREFKV